MGPDAVITRVEASSTAQGEATIQVGDSLDESIEFCVSECGLKFVKCIFEDDHPTHLVSPAGPRNAFSAMIATEKQRCSTLYLPSLCQDVKNKRSTRVIANGIISAGSNDLVIFDSSRLWHKF
jgi:hypothetical protein